MGRYLVAAMIALIYVAGTSWIVQSAGEAYRNKLRASRRLAIRPETAPPARPPTSRVTNTVTAASSVTSVPASNAAQSGSTSPAGAEVLPKASDAGAVLSRDAAGTKARSANEPSATKSPKPDSENTFAPLNPDFAWADSLDLSKLNSQDEQRLGRAIHQLILTYNRPVQNGAWDQRVDLVARPLLKLRSRKDIDYTFTILDSDAVNAFSTVGGRVYLSGGLFNLIGEDEDYALQFVLGHEIAHVDLKHALKCVAGSNTEEKKHGLGTLSQFYLLIAFGYPDKQVFEADAWAFKRMMVDLDRGRHDSLAFLRKFEDFAAKNKFQAGRQLPPQQTASSPRDAPASFLENHFRAETAAWKRLNELKTISTQLSIPSR